MILKKWDELPEYMRTDDVRPYFEKLQKRRLSLLFKRLFDIIVSFVMLLILSPLILILAVIISVDSSGGVFFRQERITRYGEKFKIFKFRTMVANAESLGSQVTVQNDMRVTKVGAVLRKFRLDEIPQLINILLGDMSFVGTRPEVPKYVDQYTPEMYATLLLPAGVTSEASIRYKDEDQLLESAENVDDVYVNQVLPGKMKYNLDSINNFSFCRELSVMVKTVWAVIA